MRAGHSEAHGAGHRAGRRLARAAPVVAIAAAIFVMSEAAASLAVGDSPDRPVFAIGAALFVVGAALLALSRMLAADGDSPRQADERQARVSKPSPARH